MSSSLLNSFNGDPVDLAVTFIQPPTDPKHDPNPRVIRVEIKAEDLEEHSAGITLKAHSSGNLLGVFVPWRMVMGIDFLREFDGSASKPPSTGQYI